MNLFVVSNPNETETERNMRIRNGFKNFFVGVLI